LDTLYDMRFKRDKKPARTPIPYCPPPVFEKISKTPPSAQCDREHDEEDNYYPYIFLLMSTSSARLPNTISKVAIMYSGKYRITTKTPFVLDQFINDEWTEVFWAPDTWPPATRDFILTFVPRDDDV